MNCAHASKGVPEDYDSSSCSDTSTTTNSISDFEAPALSPITSKTSSEVECDGSEDCLSTKQPATDMLSGSTAAGVEDLDSVA